MNRVLRFDSSDAWCIFALWAFASGHFGTGVIAVAMLVLYLLASAHEEREAKRQAEKGGEER